MKMLTETIINLFDLAEAEGRLLKQKVVETIMVALLMLVAAFMLLATLIFLVTALYYTLILWFPPPLVFLFLALLSIFMSGGLLWTAIRLNQKQ